jgi:hypothetical protein
MHGKYIFSVAALLAITAAKVVVVKDRDADSLPQSPGFFINYRDAAPDPTPMAEAESRKIVASRDAEPQIATKL